jgi:hypothetical protein
MDLGRFEKYRGHHISVQGSDGHFYVPTKEEEEEYFMVAVENLCFDKDGFKVVAIDCCIEDGFPVQTDVLLAVNEVSGEVIECDEGTNRTLEVKLQDMGIEQKESD